MTPKLILLDVFSYSCMNCLRSLDFIKKVDAEYKRFGLDTILVHPPEWEFEKNKKNILAALKEHKINFPVVIDRNKRIIKKFNVDFWPTQILITNGRVLYRHIGEGNYNALENNIRKALKIRNKKIIFLKKPTYSKFPTAYLGKGKLGIIKNISGSLKPGIIYAEGEWLQKEEFLEIKKGSITIMTKGGMIYCVAESCNGKPAIISVRLGKKFLKNLTIKKPGLYNIARVKKGKQMLTLTAKSKTAFYSFSFQ